MPIPRIFDDYDLLQAFIKLGQRMYPDKWTVNHDELNALPAEILDNWIAERKAAEKRIAELEGELAPIELTIKSKTNSELVQRAVSEKNTILSELHGPRITISTGRNFEEMEGLRALYFRKIAVEARLIEGIRKQEIKIWCAFATPGDSGPWEKRAGYHYDIELSTVWWRKGVHSKRRQFVRVFKDEFDAWLDENFPTTPRELRVDERIEQFIKEITSSSAKDRLKKPYFKRDLVTRFGISDRAAGRFWDHLPAEMKVRGAPRKKK